jgi:hypothetical protein
MSNNFINQILNSNQSGRRQTEVVQVTKTNDRPDLSSEGAPDIDKTVDVKQ